MGSEPLVSVIVATRNRADLVGRTLQSIAAQSLRSLEVIVIDDGSTPEQLASLRNLLSALDDRFRLESPLQPGSLGSGPATARNRGIEAATGRFVAFLDDDDFWVCEKYLETAVSALEACGLDFYFADMHTYRGDVLVWDTWRLDKAVLQTRERVAQVDAETCIVSRADLFRSARARTIHLDCVVLRRSLIDRAGPFLKWLYYGEDHEFLLRQADHVDRALFGPQIVAHYRLPEGNSHSLTFSLLDRHLQLVTAAQRLRSTAQSDEARHNAWRDESWHLRLASLELHRLGRRRAARTLAWQALATRPTLGNLWNLTKVVVS
jgi:glycosyltransferase involved in cell wall biosynthesis